MPDAPVTPAHVFSTFVCAYCGDRITVPIRCSDRFCDVCGRSRASRIQSRLEHLHDHVKLLKGFTFKFLTLTIPTGPDLKVQYDQVVKSFRRLRQRIWWRLRVHGGGYVIEVTVSDTGEWHVHLHAILYSAYLPVRKLSSEWSNCSPGSIVHITMITGPQVAKYITKYVSKSLALEKRTQEASDVLKGSRLFQPFGCFQKALQIAPLEPFPCSHCGKSQWYWCPDFLSADAMINRISYLTPYRDRKPARPPPQLCLDIVGPVPPP